MNVAGATSASGPFTRIAQPIMSHPSSVIRSRPGSSARVNAAIPSAMNPPKSASRCACRDSHASRKVASATIPATRPAPAPASGASIQYAPIASSAAPRTEGTRAAHSSTWPRTIAAAFTSQKNPGGLSW